MAEPEQPMSDEELSDFLDDVLAATNERRKAVGLEPLAWSDEPEPEQG